MTDYTVLTIEHWPEYCQQKTLAIQRERDALAAKWQALAEAERERAAELATAEAVLQNLEDAGDTRAIKEAADRVDAARKACTQAYLKKLTCQSRGKAAAADVAWWENAKPFPGSYPVWCHTCMTCGHSENPAWQIRTYHTDKKQVDAWTCPGCLEDS